MKKTIKVLAMMAVAILLFSLVVIPSAAEEFNFDYAIEIFHPSTNNCTTLEVGDTHTPTASVMTLNGAVCYSSDETVVTVAADGTVTAVGEGRAYVAIDAGSMYEMYRYDVVLKNNVGSAGDLQDNFVSDNSQVNSVPEVSELEIPEFNMTTGFNSPYDNDDEFGLGLKIIIGIGIIVFVSMFAFIIYMLVSVFTFSSKSMGRKILPPMKQTVNTVTAPEPAKEFCPQCGIAYGEAAFCSKCGTPKVAKSVYVVPIDKRMTAQKFEEHINEWLSQNPYIYNCKLKLDTKSSLFIPFVNHKFFVKKAVLEYSVAAKPQNHQYGFAFIFKFRVLGPVGYNSEKHVAEWNANNSDYKIISTHGGRIQHWDSKGGIWAQYYNYVFFKKN